MIMTTVQLHNYMYKYNRQAHTCTCTCRLAVTCAYMTMSHCESIGRNSTVPLWPRPTGNYKQVLRSLGQVARLLRQFRASRGVHLGKAALNHSHAKIFSYSVLDS